MKRKRTKQTRPPRPLDRDDLARIAGGDETRNTMSGSGFYQIRDEGG